MIIEKVEILGVEYENYIPDDGFVFVRKSDGEKFTGVVLGIGEIIEDYEEKPVQN